MGERIIHPPAPHKWIKTRDEAGGGRWREMVEIFWSITRSIHPPIVGFMEMFNKVVRHEWRRRARRAVVASSRAVGSARLVLAWAGNAFVFASAFEAVWWHIGTPLHPRRRSSVRVSVSAHAGHPRLVGLFLGLLVVLVRQNVGARSTLGGRFFELVRTAQICTCFLRLKF